MPFCEAYVWLAIIVAVNDVTSEKLKRSFASSLRLLYQVGIEIQQPRVLVVSSVALVFAAPAGCEAVAPPGITGTPAEFV